MSTFTQQDAIAAGWSFTQEQPEIVDQNSGKVTPPCYRAEKFINDSTLGEVADSPQLLLTRISLFEEQLARGGASA